MADYKVIYKAEGKTIPWEPGYPVVITAIQISRDVNSSEAYLQAKALNVANARIESIGIELEFRRNDGSISHATVSYPDADIPAGKEVILEPNKLPRGDVNSCAATVAWAKAADKIWKSSAKAEALPSREELSLTSRALEQRARNLETSSNRTITTGKLQDHGDWWVCACGQVNVRRNACLSCACQREELIANEDEAKLLADADKHDAEEFREAKGLQQEDSILSLSTAIKKYESLENNEDAFKRIAECEARLIELKALRKKSLRKIGAVLSVVILFVAVALVTTQIVIPAREQAARDAEAAQIQEAKEQEAAQERALQEERAKTFAKALAPAEVGQTLEFGLYEQDGDTANGREQISWRVLATENNRVLLVSDMILETRTFNDSPDGTYENSTLKEWLETTFADSAFSAESEKDLLIDGPFCLSPDDAESYFASEQDRICYPTEYAKSEGVHVSPVTDGSQYWLSRAFRYDYYNGTEFSHADVVDTD